MTDRSFAWPDGALGAVSLSFDDGPQSSIDTVIPMLDEHGLKGTFYLSMGDDGPFYRCPDDWRAAALAGHEIGNHSMTHPCSRNLGFSPINLDMLTFDQMREQVAEAKRRLEEGIPEQKEHSYAYPCGETHVGSGTTRQSYVPAVAEHYVVGRWLGDGVTTNDPVGVDLACVWAPMPVGRTGSDLIGIAEEARTKGKWAVIAFHGIGDAHLANTAEAFGALLDHLVEHSDEIMTETVAAAGRWIHDNR